LILNKVDRSSGNKIVEKVNIQDIDQINFAFPDHKKMINDAFLL
jgi:hypothetical protein